MVSESKKYQVAREQVAYWGKRMQDVLKEMYTADDEDVFLAHLEDFDTAAMIYWRATRRLDKFAAKDLNIS